MKALIYKEINSFFGSLMGYLVVGVFLMLNGLFLWILNGPYNILQSGYNDLTPFFKLSPWVLLLLVPAVTMKSFAEERKQGTLELLLTKPMSVAQIVGGKFLGSFLLIFLALVPTLVYVLVLQPYGTPVNNIDLGSVLGSYLGLLFLVASYTAIGVFASLLSENQMVAFIVAVIICYFMFIGLEQLTEMLGASFSRGQQLGMNYHFLSMSRGVIDSRDLIYFCSIALLFLASTVFQLKKMRNS